MKTMSINKFLSLYHDKIKSSNVRLGQALSTTFFKPTNTVCEVSVELNDDDALAKFKMVSEQAQWDLESLIIIDDYFVNYEK